MDKIKVFTAGSIEDLQSQLDAFVTDKIQVVSVQCSVSEQEYFVALTYRSK